MKLRSIVLAGLIGTSLLTMSGCNVEDTINDLIKPNAIYIVNGYGSEITAYANNESHSILNKKFRMFSTDSGDTDVYYKVGNNASSHKSLAYGNAHLYVASSECNLQNGLGFVTDVSTGQGVVEVVNATNTPLRASSTTTMIVHVKNGNITRDTIITVPRGREVPACGKLRSDKRIADLGIEQGSVVSVTIGNTTSSLHTVTDNVPTTVDVDLVYLGGEDAVAVALVKWDDLI